jgi:putative drug exporter of the RND superfamily
VWYIFNENGVCKTNTSALNFLSGSRFDSLNSFIRRRHRLIIVAWVVVIAVSLVFIPSFFSAVSYNITSVGGPTNTESQQAANILAAQFPGSSNSSTSSILVVFTGTNVFSSAVKDSVLKLNSTLASDSKIQNFTGMTSVYTTELGLLNSSVPALLGQLGTLESSIISLNSAEYSLQGNLSALSMGLFQLQTGINQTAELVYGIPSSFLQIWETLVNHGLNATLANEEANATLYNETQNFGGSSESAQYFGGFYQGWSASFAQLPNSTSPEMREARIISQVLPEFSNATGVSPQTRQILALVGAGLNVSDYNQANSISNLTIFSFTAEIPSQLSTSLGVTTRSLVNTLYSFGPSPSSGVLSNYTISIFNTELSQNSSSGISVPGFAASVYDLGSNYGSTDLRNLASGILGNSTQTAFAASPLFVVNGTSLGDFIESLPVNATSTEISNTANSLITNLPYLDYPFVPTRAITQDLVSKDNQTTIAIFNFSYNPSPDAINQFKADVQNSGLTQLGTTYVTGSSVIAQDLQDAFTPALSITIGPGIAISILIVGLLFMSPIAALIPIIMGGISVSIALSAIYVFLVKIGKGNITFLTPTLTILLILGLAVDYAVLQLRRTREERQNGHPTEESVGISVKWAGQAVLTAGITVIVAYIVMAVANVPLFSDVGTAIALGVSILLVASLTLLPAIELSMKDRIFWPGMKRHLASKKSYGETRLEKVAKGTLHRKILIVAGISVLALTALYTTYNTPTGANFLKLIPNFPSNQGLTVIGNNLGSGTIAPATIILTTSSPIVTDNATFGQSFLDQIEQLSNAAANTSGVVSVIGPTRPYGQVFDYARVNNLSAPIRVQYISGMLAQIGQNNETALINVGLSSPSESQAAIDTLLAMESRVKSVGLSQGEALYFGGDTQATYDSQSFLNNLLPEIIAILGIAVYVILFIQLRSVFTPLRLIFTILCSVVISLSVVSITYYHVLNLPILDFVPLFVVVTMLGVGIDYDIFFVTRIREEVLNGKTDDEAIVRAVDRVWVTILGLGLVLSTVFASLLITGIPIFGEISLGVASAILVDVSVVILFFVPSLMGLAQRVNWWPSKIGRSQKKN